MQFCTGLAYSAPVSMSDSQSSSQLPKLPSHTEENYLKAIFKLAEAEPDTPGVSTNRIAAALDTRAASVTDMLRRLAEKGLLNYEKYRGVQLTAEGPPAGPAHHSQAPAVGSFSGAAARLQLG